MLHHHFTTTCADERINVVISPVSQEDNVFIYSVRLDFPEKMIPPAVRISWEENMENILHIWHPGARFTHELKQWFAPTLCNSCFHAGAPVLTTIGDLDLNRATVAVSDPETPIRIGFFVKDLQQNYKVEYFVEFFSQPGDARTFYETLLRIDCREIPYETAISHVYPWWQQCGYEIPPIPSAAEDALYSSWYSFHQAPKDHELLEDLEIASKMGFKTVILDDGWQFPGPSSGDYALCGAWEVSEDKFADFKSFTESVHNLGMKLIVWFAVPFVGIDSPLFEKFKDKLLCIEYGNMNTGVLDPRYPEVREFITSTYKRFLLQYDIDGFKLDFIDSFIPNNQSAPYDPLTMDCESISEAVNRLLTEITQELGKIKPDLLYEYRQGYVGPAINRYGNMLRVADCAYDAQRNKVGVTDLRLMNYPTAVHSDMLYWAPSESVKLCTRQLLNVLFSVPQISVRLTESTAEQKELLQNFLRYWVENKETLLHGTFRAKYPEQNFTCISSENAQKNITVVHGDLPFTYRGKTCEVFHNGNEDGMIIENATDSILKVEIFENFHNEPIAALEIAPYAIQRVPVSQTGMTHIRQE